MRFSPRAYNAPSNFPCGQKHQVHDAAKRSRDAAGQRAHRPLAGSSILVVEDEFIIAFELQANLEEAGAVVVGPAHTLAAALELAAHEQISAATLDLRLARDSVDPVARILTERGIPFVFYSGQPAADKTRALWPHSKLISKPAEPEEIIETVAELIGSGAAPH